ncbi:MAG: sigma-70 family RNA polymerase sigma factor [Planctomycetota bacterium]
MSDSNPLEKGNFGGPNDAESHDLESRVAQTRDANLLGDYMNANQPRLLAMIQRKMGGKLAAKMTADDLYQELARAALAGLADAPFEKYSVWSWLCALAVQRVADGGRYVSAGIRNSDKEQAIHGSDDSGSGGLEAMLAASITSPSAALSQDVRMTRLSEAIAQLPEDQRTAITLRYLEGLPTKEIADRMGKQDVAVRVMLSRCVRTLEKLLQDVRPTR